MTYTPNVPLATERIAATQAPINANFTSANTFFGLDHVAFDAAGNNGKHKYVTMIDETATPPTPGASECAIYSKTTAAVTTPFLRRDGLGATPEYALMPIRAYGTFTTAGVIINAFNLTSSAFVPASGYTMTMPAGTVTSTTYGVIVTGGFTGLNPGFGTTYIINTDTVFNVGFRRVSTTGTIGSFQAPEFFTVIVLQV